MTRKNLSKDSKYRKETKEEKRARLESAQASREACQRIAPFILGAVLLLILVFSHYVNTVPLRVDPAASAESPSVPLETEEKIKVSVNEALQKMEDEAKASKSDETEGEL